MRLIIFGRLTWLFFLGVFDNSWQWKDILKIPIELANTDYRHLSDLRNPAASASSGVQNHRRPPPISILITG
jgi:hypothetical protein